MKQGHIEGQQVTVTKVVQNIKKMFLHRSRPF